VKGLLYACEWLQDPIVGDYPGHELRPIVVSRTRALWVPEESLLLQWVPPNGVVQASRRDAFPPPESEARVKFLEQKNVPYAVIRESRAYLKRMEHIHAQEMVIQLATARNTALARQAESKLQLRMDESDLRG
jgi:hypothetical protein